jgi:hypothetical protein
VVTTLQKTVAVLRRDHDVVDQLNNSNLPAETATITVDGKRLAVGNQVSNRMNLLYIILN